MKANVYVDGFNLYHAALKGTPYKWLDLPKLARFLLPDDRIHRIRYFTALIHMPRDQPKEQRQQTYIRARGCPYLKEAGDARGCSGAGWWSAEWS